jgi:hypothetical protein
VLAGKWTDLTSEMIRGDDVVLCNAEAGVQPCCLKYGIGHCQENFDQRQRLRLLETASKLKALVNFKYSDDPCDFLVPWLPLFLVTCDGTHRLLLMVAKHLAPQTPIFLDCELLSAAPGGLPYPDCLVQVKLEGSACMHVPGDLASECSANGNSSIEIRSVRYECLTLQTFKVIGIDDDYSQNLKSRKAKAPARDRDFDLVQDWGKLKHTKKRRKGSLGNRRLNQKSKPVETEPDPAEDDLWATGVGYTEPMDPDAEARLFGDSSGDDDAGAGPSGAGSVLDEEGFTGRDVAAHTLREINEAEREMTGELPVWNPGTCQVTLPGSTQILGRIKPIHPNTSKEAVSIYCRLHQCAPPLRRLATAPTNAQILRWFLAGKEQCPGGTQGRAEHLRLFKTMCAHTPG